MQLMLCWYQLESQTLETVRLEETVPFLACYASCMEACTQVKGQGWVYLVLFSPKAACNKCGWHSLVLCSPDPEQLGARDLRTQSLHFILHIL